MTPQETEGLRLTLLRLLSSNRTSFGIQNTLLLALAKAEGRPTLNIHEVSAELGYLEDKGLVARVPKPVSPELALWRVTAAGRDFMAERGFET